MIQYTGNAWAAAGMWRVLGTLKRSVCAQNFENQRNDLGSWVSEIHCGMYPHLVRCRRHCVTHHNHIFIHPLTHPLFFCNGRQPYGLFIDYADRPNDSNSNNNFDGTSGGVLLAATVYHLELLTGDKTFIPQAERTRAALFAAHGTPAPSSPPHSASAFAHWHTPHFTTAGRFFPDHDMGNQSINRDHRLVFELFVVLQGPLQEYAEKQLIG